MRFIRLFRGYAPLIKKDIYSTVAITQNNSFLQDFESKRL
jgi:hypothetical protein